MDLSVAAATEVEELHAAIEDWFAGRVEEDALDRIDRALASDFEIVGPTSERRNRAAMLGALEDAHGSQAASVPPFEIDVEDVRTRAVDGAVCVVTYEEWQHSDGEETGRLSTATFRERADAPNGVEWVHLHETWLSPPSA